MSYKLWLGLQIILHFTLTLQAKMLHQKENLSKTKHALQEEDRREDNKEDYVENEINKKKSLINDEVSEANIPQKQRKKTPSKIWIEKDKAASMASGNVDYTDEETDVDNTEQGEIEGVRWNPLANEISYKIVVTERNKVKENVSVVPLFMNEEKISVWSALTKNDSKLEDDLDFNNDEDKTTELDTSLKFPAKKYVSKKNRAKNKNHMNFQTIKIQHETNLTHETTELYEEAFMEDQPDYEKNEDASLKSEENKMIQQHTIVNNGLDRIPKGNSFIENGEIEGLNWEEKGKKNIVDLESLSYLDMVKHKNKKYGENKLMPDKIGKDKLYKSTFKQIITNEILDDSASEENKLKNKTQGKGTKIKQIKSYMQKEIDDLNSRYDGLPEEKENHIVKAEKNIRTVRSDYNLEKQIGKWLPVFTNRKLKWVRHDAQNKNSSFNQNDKLIKTKPEKDKDQLKDLSKEMEYNNSKTKEVKSEIYKININLEGVTEQSMPIVKKKHRSLRKQAKVKGRKKQTAASKYTLEDNKIDLEGGLPIKKSKDNQRKKLKHEFDILTLSTTDTSVKNFESEIRNSYLKNGTEKVIEKRQSVDSPQGARNDKFDVYLPETPEYSENKNPTNPDSKRKKKKHRGHVHEWFARSKNKTVNYFSKLGKKIKQFFKKNHHHRITTVATTQTVFQD